MEIQILPLIIVVAYLVGMLTVGAVVSKVQIKNAKDYMVAGRRMGLFMVAFSLSANNIGGGCTTGLAQKAFGDWGLSAVWYVLAASIAMIPLAYFAPKIRKTMAVTIPEVVGRRFGKFSSNFTAILSVLSLFCLTSSQIVADIAASGGVINALIPSIPLNVCLIFAGIVWATRYVSLGSVCGALIAPIGVLAACGKLPALLSLFCVILLVAKHRSNIRRLIEHKESKLSFKKDLSDKFDDEDF